MIPFEINKLEYSQLPVEESLFTLGNGYLGVRGNFEEGYPTSVEEIRGTYCNGVYARIPVVYPEPAYGFPLVADKQPRLFDTQTMLIYLDGEQVSLNTSMYSNYTRQLFMDKGMAKRSFSYTTVTGKKADISFTRMVSLIEKELFVIRLKIKYEGEIEVRSTLNADVENYTNPDDPRVGGAHAKLLTTTQTETEDYLYAQAQVSQSGIEVSCGVDHIVKGGVFSAQQNDNQLSHIIKGRGELEVIKLAVYCDSLRHYSLQRTTRKILTRAKESGWQRLAQLQQEHYQEFWSTSDIVIKEDELQMAVRFAIYQLYQSVGKDEHSNVSAKGLSGEGYEGHYFWDTEIYINPYYLVTHPEIAKNLILFRYRQIPLARKEARNLGAKRGIKFPWRTISGIECSAYFPAGQAQYHINGAVAYTIIQYFLAHDDNCLIDDYGMEMLLEISLFFLEIGHFKDGRFCIDGVTGPDEYTAIVDNNYYTNMLVQHCFQWTKKFFDGYHEKQQQQYLKKTGCTIDDIALMAKAGEEIVLPFDSQLNIALQDENFLELREWKKEDNKRPLLLNYHPLYIYNAQVLKQPDAVLAHFLKEDITTFESIKDTYNFYEERTTHDSSLSSCVYGIMACRINHLEKASDYFYRSVFMDMKNMQGNTRDGLHMANLAGTSMYMIYGFAGLRITPEGIKLRPVKPKDFPPYSFEITVKNSILKIQVEEEILVERLSGNLNEIIIFDKKHSLSQPIRLPLNS